MRILVRTSSTAIWARRCASLALPLAVFPIFLHRQQAIDSETFSFIEMVAIALAALGLLLGVFAMVRLWFTGDRGWSRALTGVFIGTLCLLPLGFSLALAARVPALIEVATPGAETLPMVRYVQGQPVTQNQRTQQLNAFPNAVGRAYQLSVNRIFQLVSDEVEARGWDVIAIERPDLERAEGQINALDVTLVGWRDEMAIKVRADGEGASVLMRSASLFGMNDLGRNGSRVEGFLLALDARVSDELRNAVVFEGPATPPESPSIQVLPTPE